MVPACKRVEVAAFALDADSKLTIEPFLFEVGTEGDLFGINNFLAKSNSSFDSIHRSKAYQSKALALKAVLHQKS